jgi:hypothetical protein
MHQVSVPSTRFDFLRISYYTKLPFVLHMHPGHTMRLKDGALRIKLAWARAPNQEGHRGRVICVSARATAPKPPLRGLSSLACDCRALVRALLP